MTEIEAIKETENLSADDILKLLEEKWIVPVIKGLDSLFDKVIMDFINQLEKLSLKYDQKGNVLH